MEMGRYTECSKNKVIFPPETSQTLRGYLGENDVHEPVSDSSCKGVSTGTDLHRLFTGRKQLLNLDLLLEQVKEKLLTITSLIYVQLTGPKLTEKTMDTKNNTATPAIDRPFFLPSSF